MYNDIMRGFSWLGEGLTTDILAILAVTVLGIVFVANIVLLILFKKACRYKGQCVAEYWHQVIRRTSYVLGWFVFGFFAFYILFVYNVIATMVLVHLAMPIALMLLIYLVNFVFSFFCRCCKCDPCTIKFKEEPKLIIQQQTKPIRKRPATKTIAGSKTTTELKKEHENLRAEYHMLEQKLVQMSTNEDMGRTTSTYTKTGYYSDENSFNRTGSGQLTKTTTTQKYDESEVRQALDKLKIAMDDLHKQIEAREDK